MSLISTPESSLKQNSSSITNNLNNLSSYVVSEGECKYIREGIQLCVRSDGRKLKNFRFGKICHSFISTANGSASYENYENYVLAVVKFELVSTHGEEKNDENGDMHIAIDFPTCNIDAVRFMSFNGDDAANYMCKFIKNFCLTQSFFNKNIFCILKNYFYWNAFVDIVVLRMGGNLLDAITIAIRAALQNTVIPKVTVYREIDEEDERKDYQIEVEDLVSSAVRFPYENIPICITAGEVNRCYVWDLSAEEECCTDCLVITAVNTSNKNLSIHKSGGKPIDMGALRSITKESEKIGKEVLQQLDLILQN